MVDASESATDTPKRAAMSLGQLSALTDEELGVSSWFLVDQKSINAFADITRDWQPIHIDETAASEGPFGRTIAHGFLTLSLLSAMAYEVIPSIEGACSSINYGINSLRFVAPVRSGERVRGRFVLKQVIERAPRSYQLTVNVKVEIEDQPKPALAAEWLMLFNT
jgi:acyl dehydratase